MTKPLTEMTLEELWRLFPISLAEHDPLWERFYAEELQFLKSILPFDVTYYHIGSTAIKNIYAKPIIDIIISADSIDLLHHVAEILAAHNYIKMSESENRISFNKGYMEKGFAERVFHLHLRLKNDIDEVYFRDHLNIHPEVAQEYETLKLRLAKQYKYDRDAYTAAKTEFVKKYTEQAKLNS